MIKNGRVCRQEGFTLIELIVSLSILMLLSAMGLSMIKDFNGKQKLESAKEEILANLRVARNYATTNQLPNNADRVLFSLSSTGDLIIKPQNSAGDVGSTFLTKDLFTSEIGATIVGSPIVFSVTDGRSLNGNIGITLVSNPPTTNKNILIQSSGNIYEK